jgi:hypothetical protein
MPRLAPLRFFPTSDREFVSLALGDGPPAARLAFEEGGGGPILTVGIPGRAQVAHRR